MRWEIEAIQPPGGDPPAQRRSHICAPPSCHSTGSGSDPMKESRSCPPLAWSPLKTPGPSKSLAVGLIENPCHLRRRLGLTVQPWKVTDIPFQKLEAAWSLTVTRLSFWCRLCGIGRIRSRQGMIEHRKLTAKEERKWRAEFKTLGREAVRARSPAIQPHTSVTLPSDGFGNKRSRQSVGSEDPLDRGRHPRSHCRRHCVDADRLLSWGGAGPYRSEH